MSSLIFKILSHTDIANIANTYPNRMSGIGAWMGDQLVGWGLLTCWRAVGEISDLWVDERHRNHGIGTRLIATLAHMAMSRGVRQLEIGVDKTNPAARRLYERLGFVFHRTIGELVYLRCPTHDIIIRATDAHGARPLYFHDRSGRCGGE